jgi:hypothetical protein
VAITHSYHFARLVAALAVPVASLALVSCATGVAAHSGAGQGTAAGRSPAAGIRSPSVPRGPAAAVMSGSPLPSPPALTPFTGSALTGQGVWHGAGRRVHGLRAVFETRLVPPGGRRPAGIAWMDTRLLSARLYSGSISPGGGPYRFTAPVGPAQARTLVAAFNGGFKMNAAQGGYYTEGRVVDRLHPGAASLVIYRNGSVNIGAWGDGLTMTHAVASVRQNLVLLVAGGRPTPAASGNWKAWGNTCGANSCAASVPGIKHQWRSALGITADGALVYAVGPGLDPLQLAHLLVRAGAVRGMQLDINPYWPVFVTYDPVTSRGLAAPPNGSRLLGTTVQGPATFFEPSWARDFVTISARR